MYSQLRSYEKLIYVGYNFALSNCRNEFNITDTVTKSNLNIYSKHYKYLFKKISYLFCFLFLVNNKELDYYFFLIIIMYT